MRLAAVAAVSENGVIGKDGDVPWDLPEDRRQYRTRVADSPVIFGRKTFQAMQHDLPGNAQIVLTTQDRTSSDPSIYYVDSVDSTLTLLESFDTETAYVLGGASIYEAFLPHLDDLYLSRVPTTIDGDAHFPDFDRETWRLVDETEYDTFTLEHWQRSTEQPS